MKLRHRTAAALIVALLCGATHADLDKGKRFYEVSDNKRALLELTAPDTVDSLEAQRMIGAIYFNWNKDVPRDLGLANEWFTKSLDRARILAAQGDAKAQYHLGVLSDKGWGVAEDAAQAVVWYRKAAEQGLADAQVKLGKMYASSRGVAQDRAQAVSWMRKAAEQGDASGQYELGLMYEGGLGVAQDLAQAVAWWRKAAKQGLANAQGGLGLYYKIGEGGLLQDYEAATKWYELAARQGFSWDQRELFLLHRDGKAPKPDLVVALAWINLAASGGLPHPDAAKERNELAGLLTPAQVAEAQRLAREWKLGEPLGKSKLKAVDPNARKAAAPDPQPYQASNDPYPPRPQGQPGVTTCRTSCVNGDCYRTYSDGRKKHFQAQQKWNPFNSQFEWDSGSC